MTDQKEPVFTIDAVKAIIGKCMDENDTWWDNEDLMTIDGHLNISRLTELLNALVTPAPEVPAQVTFRRVFFDGPGARNAIVKRVVFGTSIPAGKNQP